MGRTEEERKRRPIPAPSVQKPQREWAITHMLERWFC
jgi:hypothetical protein